MTDLDNICASTGFMSNLRRSVTSILLPVVTMYTFSSCTDYTGKKVIAHLDGDRTEDTAKISEVPGNVVKIDFSSGKLTTLR